MMTLKQYLLISKGFPSGDGRYWVWGILFAWLALVSITACFHELWKDEARALFLAISPDSLSDLPAVIKNEGHPLLWYILLRLAYALVPTPLVLQLVGLVIGFGAVVLFLRSSPFANWFKIIFIFSLLPIYEYTVLARNYGISMLLLFVFCHYLQTEKKTLAVFLSLALLANTNIPSLIFALLLLVLIIYQQFSSGAWQQDKVLKIMLAGFLATAGVVLTAYFLVQDQQMLLYLAGKAKPLLSISYIPGLLSRFGSHYTEIFPLLPAYATHLIFLGLTLGLLGQPSLALAFAAGTILLTVVFDVFYAGSLRHQGLILVFAVTLYWLMEVRPTTRQASKGFAKLTHALALHFLLPAIFLAHLYGAYKYIRFDLTSVMSCNKPMGEFINRHADLKDAIVIGEPENNIESLPYYIDNRIYFPRSQRFGTYVVRSRATQKHLTLGELTATAKMLRLQEKAPVLIALGHFDLAGKEQSQVRTLSHNRIFSWTDKEMADFFEATSKMTECKNDYREERYELYRLKE